MGLVQRNCIRPFPRSSSAPGTRSNCAPTSARSAGKLASSGICGAQSVPDDLKRSNETCGGTRCGEKAKTQGRERPPGVPKLLSKGGNGTLGERSLPWETALSLPSASPMRSLPSRRISLRSPTPPCLIFLSNRISHSPNTSHHLSHSHPWAFRFIGTSLLKPCPKSILCESFLLPLLNSVSAEFRVRRRHAYPLNSTRLIVSLAACFALAFHSRAETIDLLVGTIDIPKGVTHHKEQGIDSLVGSFVSTDGTPTIEYDIDVGQRDVAIRKRTNELYFRSGLINGTPFYAVIAPTNPHYLSIVFTHCGPANFAATVYTSEDIERVLKLLQRFTPYKK
jgi:hypothetical protein